MLACNATVRYTTFPFCPASEETVSSGSAAKLWIDKSRLISSRTGNNLRILILVSDGQPADAGYSGTAAEEDLRGIKQEYKRKGLLFVAAAIGDDKQNIERIYGDSFLDITDLNQLPMKLTAVIKRFMRF